jgi:NAD(P)-dependent dehydrogenase (short-subunit alcohol dehydrogenase family)
VNARRAEYLVELARAFPPGRHLVCPGDYSDDAVAKGIQESIQRDWGRLDVLVNCAGISIPAHSLDAPLTEWRKAFDIMVNGAVYMTRMAARLMSQGGRIIHVTSIHGERAEKMSSGYGMAKAAINEYVRCLAVELAERGILVNAIAPGFIKTPMSVVNGVDETETEWFRLNYVDGHHLPLRRPGKPEEVAGVALFLAGEDATYMTGQVLTVDGGLTITF